MPCGFVSLMQPCFRWFQGKVKLRKMFNSFTYKSFQPHNLSLKTQITEINCDSLICLLVRAQVSEGCSFALSLYLLNKL